MIPLSGHSNIYINGELIVNEMINKPGPKDEALWEKAARNYEKSVERLLLQINQSATGRAVLLEIDRQAPRKMRIEPLLDVELVDPRLRSRRRKNKELEDNTPYYAPNAYARADDLRSARRDGSDTTISFSPAHWIPNDILSELIKDLGWIEFRYFSGPGANPDEMLLHEVVHGLRHMSGVRIARNIPFQRRYSTFEEFYAILVTNIYRSELGRTDLRRDHNSFDMLASIGIKNQTDFYNYRMNKFHLRKLRNQQPLLFTNLKLIKAPFNPTTLVDSK